MQNSTVLSPFQPPFPLPSPTPGSGSEGAQTALQEGYNKDMSFAEAETLALQTLKQVMEEQITSGNVEVAAVKVDKPYHLYSKEETDAILGRLTA